MLTKKFYLIYLLLLTGGLLVTHAQTQLIVKNKTGGNNNYNLSSVKKLIVQEDSLKVFYNSTQVKYAFSSISQLVFTNLPVGIIENDILKNEVTLYPNPVKENLFINAACLSGQTAHITIVNLSGQIIYRMDLNGLESEALLMINVSDWQYGLYVVKITTYNTSNSIKFLKN